MFPGQLLQIEPPGFCSLSTYCIQQPFRLLLLGGFLLVLGAITEVAFFLIAYLCNGRIQLHFTFFYHGLQFGFWVLGELA